MSKEKTRLILPCAGFGTRMKMEHDKSKELLLYEGIPLIEWHLNIAKQYDLEPLVITRKEKTDLISYCQEHKIETQIIEVSGEWPDTILKSEPYWHQNNILMLPDTRFDPTETIDEIKTNLEDCYNFSCAIHFVEDAPNWGIITGDGFLLEKPPEIKRGWAWGIIGFKNEVGGDLFLACKTREPFQLKDYETHPLFEFKDLTRTGIIE